MAFDRRVLLRSCVLLLTLAAIPTEAIAQAEPDVARASIVEVGFEVGLREDGEGGEDGESTESDEPAADTTSSSDGATIPPAADEVQEPAERPQTGPGPQGSGEGGDGDGAAPGDAREDDAGATSTADQPADLPPPGEPRVGEDVTLAPVSGVVTVRAPGDSAFSVLTAGGQVPVGAVVDARRGAVALTSAADDRGRTQTGTFSGGMFAIRQRAGARPVTELILRGGDFRRCGRRASPRAVARAAARPRVVRKLWGRDRGGRFRTRGRHAAATVRGTVWLTEDRCDGTRVLVREGAVDVRRRPGAKRRRVRAGQSHLVRRR